ncbi:MAG: hypothetical protein ABIG44_08425 [Planctomycetota bacterium]
MHVLSRERSAAIQNCQWTKLTGFALTFLLPLAACTAGRPPLTPLERAIDEAARPILEMDPDAVWTAGYNRLVELAPASIAYLAEHPVMQRPAAPDDLRVMLHISLLRLLIHPAARPQVSVNCLETALDILHFNIKVQGREIGPRCWGRPTMPDFWHELFPAEFDHQLAGMIDAESDRRTMQLWWQIHRGGSIPTVRHGLRPQPEHLWHVLSRRYADYWSYQPTPRAVRCGIPPGDQALSRRRTCDYNLVRAVCIWLGSSKRSEIRQRLIALVGSPIPVLMHNAMLALRYSADPRIRELIDEYNERMEGAHPVEPVEEGPASLITRIDPPTSEVIPGDVQRSAAHEMDQFHHRIGRAGGGRGLYRHQVRQS